MAVTTVLVADDLKTFLKIEKTFLTRAGFEVLTAENGKQAVELARDKHPRLILLDLVMPEMDGAEACAAMRCEPSLAFTPILIMSATGSPEIRDRCLAAGCTEFVVKPEQPEKLLELVARMLLARQRKVARMTVLYNEAGPAGGRQFMGMASNLSGTGLFLSTDKPVRTGLLLQLEFIIPKSSHTVTVKGQVARVTQSAGGTYEAGVHFIDLSQTDQQLILDYISS
jgi:CheY-like chemotaxis protein